MQHELKGVNRMQQQIKRPWDMPKLTFVGHIGEVIQAGGGKLSSVAGDPGEPFRKPLGQE
jgi:hypothetical protein